MIPFRVAFEDETPIPWLISDFVLDIFFFLDILLNFVTGYWDRTDGPTLVMNCRKIALNYLKSWFVLDFISTFPF